MNRFNYILIFLLSLLMPSCTQDEVVKGGYEALPASLTFTLSTVGLNVDSRSFDDPSSNPDTWTPMERAIDGREFYHVTLFLVNSKNTLVAYRDIYNSDVNGDGNVVQSPDIDPNNGFWTGYAVGQNDKVSTQIKATFQYDIPKHGDIERLVQGEYTLIAVANYSAYQDESYAQFQKYGGLNNGTSFYGLITQIKDQFNAKTGLADFHHGHTSGGTDSPISKFFNYTLDAGADFICPKQPQPLTLVKKISLHPGNNVITGELKRTYARIRINLSNNSDKKLYNDGLSFNANFAKQSTYLLEDPTKPNFVYSSPGSKGAPKVDSQDAIIPYKASTLEGKTSQVLFDAYILESKQDAANYQYTLNVGYRDNLVYLNEGQPIKDVTALDTWISKMETYNASHSGHKEPKQYFLIKRFLKGSKGEEYYLYDNGSSTVQPSELAGAKPEVGHYWTLSKSSNVYRIKAGDRNAFIGKLWKKNSYGSTYKALSEITISSDNNTFKLRNTDIGVGEGIAIYQTPNKSNKTFYLKIQYISSWSSGALEVGSQEGLQSHVPFIFYPVQYEKFDGTPASFNKDIQLTVIDPVTSVVTDVNNIKRNDFINIYINSSYSDANGIFDFEVLPWTPKNIGIEFN